MIGLFYHFRRRGMNGSILTPRISAAALSVRPNDAKPVMAASGTSRHFGAVLNLVAIGA
jgi:hypothetical protein